MQAVKTIGLDIAKSGFQVHGVGADGQVVFRRQLKRRYVLAFFQKVPSCLVGMEACATSHHWSRELQALGHTVRLMPPAYVKPYVKRQKNRPHMGVKRTSARILGNPDTRPTYYISLVLSRSCLAVPAPSRWTRLFMHAKLGEPAFEIQCAISDCREPVAGRDRLNGL